MAAGTIPFAAEIKNVRSTLFPYDHDVWDLLAKMTDFPDVLPVFVARRAHWTTFRMFKDLGVLGTETRSQFFSPTIGEDEFQRVTAFLSFRDAVLYDGVTHRGVRTFFSDTGPRMGAASLERWRFAAPILANYLELRDEDLDSGSRSEAFRNFADDLNPAGLYRGGWAPIAEDEDESDWDDGTGWP